MYALGMSGLGATKLMIVLGLEGSAFTMFWVFRRWVGNSGGLIAAILYLYSPYHAVQTYVRGAVGELWVLVFLPIVLWGLIGAKIEAHKQSRWAIGGLGFAGVILSHTIFGYITAGLILLWLILIVKDKENFLSGIKIFGFGLGLSSFFWLPAFTEMGFTNVLGQVGGGADYKNHFVCLSQFWYSAWGYGGSGIGCSDGMSFMIGRIVLILGISGLVAGLLNKDRFVRRLSSMLFILGIGSVFMQTEWSRVLWEKIPYAAYIQYPWRFLSLTTFAISGLGAGVVTLLDRARTRWVIVGLLVMIVIINQKKFFTTQYLIRRPNKSYESQEELRFRVSKISDEYLSPMLTKPVTLDQIVKDPLESEFGLVVNHDVDLGHYAKFTIKSDKVREITIKRAYFPGFRYWVNGRNVEPRVEFGLPKVIIPAGESVVELKLTDTSKRKLGNFISLVSIGYLFWLYGKKTIT